MKTKKYVKYGLLGITAALTVYLLMTPIGALRLAVAVSGHLEDAIHLQAQTAEEFGYFDDTGPSSTLYCITDHVPYYELTGVPGQNWEVRRMGPLCFAAYYGWA